ncbi:porin [Rhodoferax sp. PAMC 29310]|uniref:porin n=1 Tax=Rhodoferax sp. PAMC 29310 TaxID=2822760 RepID=UPI001B33081B|nr:porin [Rhodoferax sp. PAMC 29310]
MTGLSSRFNLPSLRAVAVASAFCCAGMASAQGTGTSSVTLYGLVDIGITQVTGLKAGTVTQVASGIMEGSRWGLKGSEDMGGGYKTIFTLESRFELDTGSLSNTPITGTQLPDRLSTTAGLGLPSAYAPLVAGAAGALGATLGVNLPNRQFDRQAYIGLVTPFGGFLAGRQYTPAYETSATYDIMQTQSGLAAGQIVSIPSAFDIRIPNALAYRFVKDGMSGSFMYGAGEVAGDSDKSRLLGFNANYKADNFSVGVGYNTRNNELGQKSLTNVVLGASMDFGNSKVSTMVVKVTDDKPSGLSSLATALGGSAAATAVQAAFIKALTLDGTLFHIGYRYVTGPNTISVAYNNYNDNRASDADVSSYGVAYTYALSKRTDLSAVLVHVDNKNTSQVAVGGNGYLGGVTASAGTDSNSLAMGIRHRF